MLAARKCVHSLRQALVIFHVCTGLGVYVWLYLLNPRQGSTIFKLCGHQWWVLCGYRGLRLNAAAC